MNEILFAMSLWSMPDDLTSSKNHDPQSQGCVKDHSPKKRRNNGSVRGIRKFKEYFFTYERRTEV